MNATDRRATHDYSRGISPSPGARPALGALRAPLLASALLGGGLLVAADASTLYSIAVVTVTKATVSGHAQHSYGLALVGLAALGLTVPAGGGRRPAMAALAVLGLAALLIAAISGDFHDVHSTGQIGLLYDGATATPGRGFYLETLGALLLVAGAVGLLLLPRAGDRRDHDPPAATAAAEPGRRARAGGADALPGGDAPRRRPAPATDSPSPPPPAPTPAPSERDPDDWFA